MPPKGRKSLSLWQSCDSCNSIFSSKDSEIHMNQCFSTSHTRWEHGFISNKTLYSFIETIKDGDLGNKLLNDVKNEYVFISQSAMQLCEFRIGSLLKVDVEGIILLKKVWPTNEGSLTTVRLIKEGFDYIPSINPKGINMVKVSKLDGVIPAKEVQFQILRDHLTFMRTDLLLEMLPHIPTVSFIYPGQKVKIDFYGKSIICEIINCFEGGNNKDLQDELKELSLEPRFYLSNSQTKWNLINESSTTLTEKVSKPSLKMVGGYKSIINEVISDIKSSLKSTTEIPGSQKCYGILFYGAHGTGKTFISHAIAHEMNVSVHHIQSFELFSKYSGEAESQLKSAFQSAMDNKPSIIILDNVGNLCPIKGTDQERRIVGSLFSCFDMIKYENIVVIATIVRPDDIDPGLRRPGRLEREIEVPVPNPLDRYDILSTFNEDEKLEQTISKVAEVTHGFVGADLAGIWHKSCLKAAMNGMNSVTPECLTWALTQVKPSAMREVCVQVPNVLWSDIGGQDDLKLKLKQAIEWPIRHPESFKKLGITPPKGVLMFGPPGCSKTMIAKALATESKLNFLTVKGSDIFSKWVGESEKAVRDLFRRARSVAPSIIFLDEVDALGGEREAGRGGGGGDAVRERVLSQLLTEMDGVQSLENVVIVAATNRPDRIDKALLRPGRLDRLIYVPLPNFKTREQILKLQFIKTPISPNIKIEVLAEKTDGFSGAEIVAVCKEAALKALEENIHAQIVKMDHFELALSIITPRTPKSLLELYEKY